MKRYTQRELKNLVALGAAEDITKGDNETRKAIEASEGYYTQIGYSAGVCGPNICIDTNYNEIRGFWGSDRESAWLPSEIAEEIDNIFEEIYNC